MIVIKINKCPFSLLIAISITKESPSKPRPWQAKARISKIESLFSCLLVPLHCTRSRNTRSLLQNLIRSTKGPGKARFYLKPLVEVNQAILAWSFWYLNDFIFTIFIYYQKRINTVPPSSVSLELYL